MSGKKARSFVLFCQPFLRSAWPVVARGRAVNVGGPVLDLCDLAVPLLERLVLEDPEFPREKPWKYDRHDTTNGDHTIDKDEGKVKNDVQGSTIDALGIDEINIYDVCQTLSGCRRVGPVEVHGKGLVVEGVIGVFQNVECLGTCDLYRRQPVQEVQVEIVTVDTVRIYKIREVGYRLTTRRWPNSGWGPERHPRRNIPGPLVLSGQARFASSWRSGNWYQSRPSWG